MNSDFTSTPLPSFRDAEEPLVLAGGAQHIGARPQQEDAYAITEMDDPHFVGHAGVLGIVADGIGGFQGGEEASELAVRTFIKSYLKKPTDESLRDTLVRALFAANDAVIRHARENSLEGNLGSTLVASVVHGNVLHWVSAGDSRSYLLRDGKLRQLTTDHVYSTELLRKLEEQSLPLEIADGHPDREAITSYVGFEELSAIDQNMRPFALQNGDRILLCTDGLYRTLSDEEIVAAADPDPQQMADTLIELALAKEVASQDNISVVILQVSLPQRDPNLRQAAAEESAFEDDEFDDLYGRGAEIEMLRRKIFLFAVALLTVGALAAAALLVSTMKEEPKSAGPTGAVDAAPAPANEGKDTAAGSPLADAPAPKTEAEVPAN